MQWVGAKISASLSILKPYRETFEVDSSSKHVPHDDEHSEFANSTFFASVDLLSVSAMLADVSIAWMDENILFDDCSGHISEQLELKFNLFQCISTSPSCGLQVLSDMVLILSWCIITVQLWPPIFKGNASLPFFPFSHARL